MDMITVINSIGTSRKLIEKQVEKLFSITPSEFEAPEMTGDPSRDAASLLGASVLQQMKGAAQTLQALSSVRPDATNEQQGMGKKDIFEGEIVREETL